MQNFDSSLEKLTQIELHPSLQNQNQKVYI